MKDSLLVSRTRKWFSLLTGHLLPGGVGCTLTALVLAAGTPALAATPAVVADCLVVEQAFARNNIVALEAFASADPQWRALQAFRLAAIHIPLENKTKARTAVRRGLAAVAEGLDSERAASAADERYRAELLLLGAMLDGQYFLIDRWRMLHNGWRALRRLRRAESLDESNLRAQLIRGTAKVVAPWALGGSAEEAVAIFAQADLSTELCADGEWAQVDVLNWLGRAQTKLADPAAAQAAYEAALARSPNNHWVRLALAGEGYEWTEHGEAEQGPE